MSQRISNGEAGYVRVGGLMQNSAENVEYEFQFYDTSSTCTGSPYKETFDIKEMYLDYESWMGDTPFWVIYRGRFGSGEELLMDMDGWSIAIMTEGDSTHLQCCAIKDLYQYTH